MAERAEELARRARRMVERARQLDEMPVWHYGNFWQGLKRMMGDPLHTAEMVQEIIQASDADCDLIRAARRHVNRICEPRLRVHVERLFGDALLAARQHNP